MGGDDPRADVWKARATAALPLVVGAVHVVFFTLAVSSRFAHPIELEWMSGGILDHVERLRDGLPLYVAPSAAFIPFLYPPLYYALSALLAAAMPVATACRVVSTAATVVVATNVFLASRRLGATRYWSAVAVALFAGTYSLVGYWYDLERSDSLLMAMLTGGLVVTLGGRGRLRTALGGALVAGAFFAKQPALVFFAAGVAGLLVVRSFARALAFALGGLAVLVPVVAWLQASTHGWFWFYCVTMPARHGIDWKITTLFFIVDASKGFVLYGVTAAVFLFYAPRALRSLRRAGGGETLEENEALFGALLAAGFFTSATSRLHIGGFVNVLTFWMTFATIATAVLATRLVADAPGGTASPRTALRTTLIGIVTLQLLFLLYDPSEACADERRERDQRAFSDYVGRLEAADGEIVVPGRGHVTMPRHFHAIALMDILRGGAPLPADIVQAIRERRWAAYVVDEMGELTMDPILGHRSELFSLVQRNYFIAQQLDDREQDPLVGWIAHPTWIYRPRQHPLPPMSDAALENRQRIEQGLATMRMRQVQAGVRAFGYSDDIEGLAAAADVPLAPP